MRTVVSPALVLVLLASGAVAAPLAISHSGFLLDEHDAPLSATVSFGFRLFDGADSEVWASDACALAVKDGYYAVTLGAACNGTPALDSTHLPAGQSRRLEVSVDGVALAPRIDLTSAPSALTSVDAQALAARLSSAGTLNDPQNPVDFSQLKNVPAGVAGGTITEGSWEATPLADAYVASATAWHAKLDAVARDTSLSGDGTPGAPLGVVFGVSAGTAVEGDDPRLSDARAPTAGSPAYLQNGTSPQDASFNVTGNGTIGGTLDVGGTVSGAAPLAQTHLATKGYVDTSVASASTSMAASFPAAPVCIYVVLSQGGASSSYACPAGFTKQYATYAGSPIDALYGSASGVNHIICCAGSLASSPPADDLSTAGYFVGTDQLYSGDLGGLAGADAKCLAELTSKSWLGKGNLPLSSSNVHAFLCDSTTCRNPRPNTRYYGARANSLNGGSSFVTDRYGRGPNDSQSWATFAGLHWYWANRNWVSPSAFTVAPATASACSDWTSSSSSASGAIGWAGGGHTDQNRFYGNSYTCNNLGQLLCMVDP